MALSPDIALSMIEEHDRSMRHFAVLGPPAQSWLGYNPRCGDKYTVYVELADGRLVQVRFMGWGCAVSRASTSMMCGVLEGLAVADALALMQEFRRFLLGEPHQLDEGRCLELLAFEGIGNNPLRLRCATLSWDALEAGLREVAAP